MALTGQESMQAPQSMQVPASITRTSPFSLIAVTGQTGSHAPQLMHSDVMVWDMAFHLLSKQYAKYYPDIPIVSQEGNNLVLKIVAIWGG